ncbi:transferrin-binding protein-like solute binding protein [Maritalea porphyrae]|uniref:transferrin-binding protein-like solute binding protein n=1 Tax=Maritalea porphyrae TaxID=880732 RepID=UPI0022AF25E6|nr:transferrin-binding protein-like solute binding protein [Maritalea porphyrae]MCZ4271856.1 transferrin-binding protein-like solute binding protein [Maritalea porphyrae]
MKKTLTIAGLLGATVMLSGCTALSGLFGVADVGSGGNNSAAVVDIDGNGSVSAGERAMTAYAATYAQDGSPSNVLSAQQRAAGISGFATGSNGLVSAAAGANGYTTASVHVSDDKKTLTITVDGKKHTISGNGVSHVEKINGKDYQALAFGYGDLSNSTNGTDVASILNGDFASLAFLFKNAKGNGQNYSIQTNEGYTMIATGLETPVDKLPSQKASYGGDFYIITNNGGGGFGNFDAIADFGNKTITADTSYEGTKNGGFTGTIAGNKFSGAVTSISDRDYEGDVVGAFYGPNAEEIAGASVGTMNNVDASAFFIGNKK